MEAAIDFYLDEASSEVAIRLVDSLEQAYAHLSERASSCSPRYGHELGLPGLRSWQLSGFPFVVFFMEYHDLIDVWRVLHGARDIPAWLSESD
jgi:toxin ParE1/3/4